MSTQVFKRIEDGRKVEVRPLDWLDRGRRMLAQPGLSYVRARTVGAKTWNTWEAQAFLREHYHPRHKGLIAGEPRPLVLT